MQQVLLASLSCLTATYLLLFIAALRLTWSLRRSLGAKPLLILVIHVGGKQIYNLHHWLQQPVPIVAFDQLVLARSLDT